jgi:hypothetical protein
VAAELHEIAPGLRIGAVGTQEMRVEREFPAPPEAVFELFTTMAVDQGGGSSRLFGTYPEVNPPWGYVHGRMKAVLASAA